ncbi:MarR family winged helix-turn-helix transcriptional regulator [Variovorax sp.]|jgi:DNA-binding MarR family transcriptional regulator|uniref:MarR family winged helix-turn-helix transcriptional regulator n=1 Tax=Variovorax sp. TaxID=1871043 RepID=UPI0037D99943
MTTQRNSTQKTAAAKDSANRPAPFNPLRQLMFSRPNFLIRRLHQIGAAIFYELCHSESITPLQVGMLTALSMNPWLDQKAIGRELALDRTTTAEVLKRLSEKGLIETRVNPDDRRSRLSVITKDGLKLIQELQDSVRHAQELLMEPLSAEDQQVFMGLLTRLVEAHELRDVAARPEASTAVDGEPPSTRRRPRAVKRPL